MQKIFKCDNCGSVNYLGVLICIKCGAKFKYSCPRCGSDVSVDINECKQCGNYLFWHPIDEQLKDNLIEGNNVNDSKKSGSWLFSFAALVIAVFFVSCVAIYAIYFTGQHDLPVVEEDKNDIEITEIVIPDTIPPEISNIDVVLLSENSVEIRWATSEASTSQVYYRLAGETYKSTLKKEALVDQHSCFVTALQPNKTYMFKVRSLDEFNNVSESDEKTFYTGNGSSISNVIVWSDSIHSEKDEYGITKTVISGKIKNTGKNSIVADNIEVIINIEIAGKPDSMEMIVPIFLYPEMVVPGEQRAFYTIVPNGTYPDYSINARVVE